MHSPSTISASSRSRIGFRDERLTAAGRPRHRRGPVLYTATMQTYMVGGAVRDALLGLAVNDHDWVVVGATPQEMISAGYLPVGKDFPVFLHPQTREEYALARTERKTARGYRGFAFQAEPHVTLEEDLARRDLTINAIAQDEAGRLIDPFDGRADLQRRVLRHVTESFREDPVRILRVARFAARFPDFSLAPETLALMREMVEVGEVDHLVAERVWQELARGLVEGRPSRMFEVLRECGALARLLPEVERLWGVPQRADYHPEIDTGVHLMMVLDMCARLQAPLPVRFACLTHDLGKGTTPAEVLPSHLGHEERSARLLQEAVRAAARTGRVPRDRRRGGARAQQHPSQRRVRAGCAGAPARALRCLSQAPAPRCHPAGLRMRRAGPARTRRKGISAARAPARCPGGGPGRAHP